MMQHGIDPRDSGMNWEGMQDTFAAEATDDLRGSILLERIAEAENIDVSDEEIEQEIERIATAARQSVEQVRAALTKQGGERSIADRLRHRKALDMIAAAAEIKDEEWREEEPVREAEAAAETNARPEATTDAPTAEAATESEAQASAAAGGEAQTTEQS
jgi:trigger factor